MNQRHPVPRPGTRDSKPRALLWVLFAAVIALSTLLLALVGWAAWSGAWPYALASGALLLLVLWRAEAWLIAVARRMAS